MGHIISRRRSISTSASTSTSSPKLSSQLGDLVEILQKVEENQRKLLELREQALQEARLAREDQKAAHEQERLASEQLVKQLLEQQKLANEHNSALVEQEKILSGSALRNEFRACRVWRRMPMLNGDPLPDDISFPSSEYKLRKEMPAGNNLAQLAAAYDIPGNYDYHHRKVLASFLQGYVD